MGRGNLYTGRFRKSIVGLIFIVLCSIVTAKAQLANLSFKHLSINDGLSQNTIFCIYQDTKGFIWIGTEDGLNRFDGYEFRIFKHELNKPKSLGNNHINTVVEDKNQNLVIGSAGGISIFDPKTETFNNISIPLSSSSEKAQSANFVTAIIPESNDQFWIATYDGLKLYNTSKKQFIQNNLTNSLKQTNVQVIFKDDKNILWISLRNELRCVNLNNRKFVTVPAVLKTALSANPGNVRVIKQDPKGNMWFGTEQSGLFYYDKSKNTCRNYVYSATNPFSLPVNVVRDIFFNDNGEVWLATRKGLSVLNPATQKITNYTHDKYNLKSLSHQSVLKIFKDKAGSIWVGTYAGGLNFYNASSHNFVKVGEKLGTLPGLNNTVVSSTLQDGKGNLWIGTEGGGLNFYNKSSGQYEYYPLKKSGTEISENIVKSLAADKLGNLWVGAFDGLYYFATTTKKFSHYPFKKEKDFSGRSQIYTVLADSSGVWAGTNGGGLVYFDPRKVLKIYVNIPGNPNSISGNNVSSLVRDKRGNIWVGTLQGLSYFDVKHNRFTSFLHNPKNKHSITSNIITTVFIDDKERLWVGTRGGGLNVYDQKSKRFAAFTENDGLANDVIRSINQDLNGNIWVGSNKGISMLKLKEAETSLKLQYVKNYSVADGLQSNQFLSGSTYRTPDGRLIFGGINGISSFYPNKIRTNKQLPEVQFTDFMINSKSVAIGTEDSPQKVSINENRNITLAYDQAYITFKFSALNFINPEKNQYAYKLEGFSNDEWHYVGNQRTAIYTNLDAGNYTLLVKAANNDGVWNEEPAKIHIRVLPPWYKTWWAYVIYLTIFASLLYFFYYYSYKTAALKNELDFEQLSHEKDQELAQRKLTFFTHISHEIKTPLTLILSPIEKLLSQQSLDNKVLHQLQLIYRNGERLMRLTNQLLDYRKFETGNMKLQAAEGNMVRFTREMIAAFKNYANSKGIELKLISDKQSIRVWFDRDKMEKIIFNLISNSMKFTSAGGYIHIKLSTVFKSQDAEYLKIQVEDDGSGIPEDQINTVFKEFQNYNTTGVNSNGTGLGLSFSKGLVELHHGSIEVSSVEAKFSDKGLTVFTVYLPLGRAHLQDSEIIQDYSNSEDIKAYEESEIPVLEKVGKKKENIIAATAGENLIMLIVEDNPDVLDFVASHFEKDFKVYTAVNGVKGLEIATEIIPDIVISDVMMPEMMGTDLCAKLKSDARTSHIPVILLTAREPLLFKIEGLETGADDYITKPFNLNYLDLKVWNLIESRIKLREKYSREITLQPTNVAISSPDEKFLEKAMKHIEDNISEPSLGVEELSAIVGMSKTTLYRKIKALTNQNTNEFIRSVRLNRAAQLLSQKKFNVNEVAYQVGFSNLNYFRKCFKEQFGTTPTEYSSKPDKEKTQSNIV